jgi:hypothetical protein
VRRANPIECINLLVNETRKPLVKDMIDLSLERIDKLIEQVPMFMLYCTISEEAVHIVKDAVGLE